MTITDERTQTTSGSGTKPLKAHIVTPRILLDAAMANGTEVTAMCGYTWRPVIVEPTNLPVCPDCRALMAQSEGRVR